MNTIRQNKHMRSFTLVQALLMGAHVLLSCILQSPAKLQRSPISDVHHQRGNPRMQASCSWRSTKLAMSLLWRDPAVLLWRYVSSGLLGARFL